jgi:hypothetical protein
MALFNFVQASVVPFFISLNLLELMEKFFVRKLTMQSVVCNNRLTGEVLAALDIHPIDEHFSPAQGQSSKKYFTLPITLVFQILQTVLHIFVTLHC